MGSIDDFADDFANEDEVLHKVFLSPFNITEYITNRQWNDIMGTNIEYLLDSPVRDISWDEIQIFIKKLEEKTNKTYRLPTEAELEYILQKDYEEGIVPNIYEWGHDFYTKYNVNDNVNPMGPSTGDLRVIRGGCWYTVPHDLRSASRNFGGLGFRDDDVSFRLVCLYKHSCL